LGVCSVTLCARAVAAGPFDTSGLEVEPGLLIGQVVKRYAKRRVVSVVHRVVRGTAEVSKPQAIAEVLRKTRTGTVINTAYIERLNATFRSALAPLACHRAFGEHADRRDVLGRLCL
jgi:hypothetical protein